MAVNVEKLKNMSPPKGIPFRIGKLGHVVLQVSDLEKSTAFSSNILEFQVSDVYPEEMMPRRIVFLRCSTDHHCLELVGGAEFREPDHHSIEIYWGVDQVGSDGRVRPANEWHDVKSLEEAIARPVPGQDTSLPSR